MKNKGQSLVEFAVALAFLLVVLAGVFELGVVLFQQVQLLDAAQEGAIFASICQDETTIRQRIVSSSSNPVDLSRTNIDIQYNPVAPIEGGEVSISITYQHKVFAPFASVFFGKYVPVHGKSSATIIKVDGCP